MDQGVFALQRLLLLLEQHLWLEPKRGKAPWQAGRLILSVPADEGWSLYVDGKKTKIKPFADALIGVHLKEGTHKIELRYTTPGVQIGAAISIAALLLFLFSMWIRYKIRGKYGEKMHQHRRTDVQ